MADACHFAQSHIDDVDAWGDDLSIRADRLQCVSMQMACFFAQNTVDGDDGVDWNIVILFLIVHPMKSSDEWEVILNKIAEEFGGWK
jgi:hypothetical protein